MTEFVKFSQLNSISSIDFETKFPIVKNGENYTTSLSAIKHSLQLLSIYVNDSTGARTVSTTNSGTYAELTHATATVITVPTNASDPIPLNSEYFFRRGPSAGAVTLSNAGVTIENGGDITSIAQGANFALKKVAENVWHFI
jgi:hypothetical protein